MEKLDITHNQYLKEVRAYAIWILKGRRPAFSKEETKGPSEFVEKTQPEKNQTMISYEWDCQDQAIEIKDKITKAGFHVWMDGTNMSKSFHLNHEIILQAKNVFLTLERKADHHNYIN